MNGQRLRRARHDAGWTQEQLASRLGVTQEYVSLMERGRRRVSDSVARSVTRVLRLPATTLPMSRSWSGHAASESWVERAVTRLGYPGFAYRRPLAKECHPGEVLLRALEAERLDERLVESLPWLLLGFDGFDLETLTNRARVRNLQNRLGFIASLAREVAERNPRWRHRVAELRTLEENLESSRLAREDTLGGKVRSERMRRWLRKERGKAAEHWNLLTDLRVEHLSYGVEHSGTLAELPR